MHLQYKDYMLVAGKKPIPTKKDLKEISEIVTADNVDVIMSLINSEK